MPISIAEQVKCVKREISMRERVYTRRVAEGKMRSENAQYEIKAMTAVLETLKKVEAEGG